MASINVAGRNHAKSTYINKEVQKLGELGVAKFIQVNKLELPDNPLEITTRTDSASASTLKNYSERWQDLLRFCYLRGDYQSACILVRATCPKSPFPCKPQTLAEYVEYKSFDTAKVLNKHGTNVPALDVQGNLIYCIDAWHSPQPIMKYMAAILKLHKYYAHLRGDYVEACTDCCNLNMVEISSGTSTWKSCPNHPGKPQIRPTGNPRLSFEMNNAMKMYYIRSRGWEVKGNTQLLPSEVRDLRDTLLNTGIFSDFQLYVMIVLGFKLFLRASELIALKVEDFEQELQILKLNRVDTMSVIVQGKTDPLPVRLVLFADDVCPEFCPVRHMLVYMAFAGIKSGYIFPSKFYFKESNYKEYNRTLNNNHCDIHMLYPEFLESMKHYMTRVLKKDTGNGKLGTHILRKTGYLFATWGLYNQLETISDSVIQANAIKKLPDLLWANVMQSARHQSTKNAITYQRDSATIYSMVALDSDYHKNRVSPWRSIIVYSKDNALKCTRDSRRFQKPMLDLCEYYVHDILNLAMDQYSNYKYVMEKSCTYVPTAIDSTKSKLETMLRDTCNISGSNWEKVKHLIDTMVEEETEISKKIFFEKFIPLSINAELATSKRKRKKSMDVTGISTEIVNNNTMVVSPGTASTSPAAGLNNKVLTIPERSEANQYQHSYQEKIKWLMTLHEKYNLQVHKLVERDRQWYVKNVKHVSNCVRTHFQGSIAHFEAYYNTVDSTSTSTANNCTFMQLKFKCTCTFPTIATGTIK